MKEKGHKKKVLEKRERRYILREARLQGQRVRKLEAELSCLWKYIRSEGFLEEAVEYVEENADSIVLSE